MIGDHPLADHLGFLLRRAQLMIFADFHERMGDLEVTPATFSVLAILRAFPRIRQNRLTEIMAIKPANGVTLINSLEKRGLLAREKLPVSGRAVALSLTEAGAALLNEADKRVDSHREHFRALLGDRDQEVLFALLRRLIEPEPSPPKTRSR